MADYKTTVALEIGSQSVTMGVFTPAGRGFALSRYARRDILLDPVEEEDSRKMPDKKSKLLKTIIELPVFGPLLYHMAFSNCKAAHMGGASARYLYASIVGRYTNMDVAWMLEELDIPIHVIEITTLVLFLCSFFRFCYHSL